MSDEQWRHLEQLYHAAVEVSATDRPQWLTRMCAGDEALRRELEGLLRYDDAADGFLEGSTLTVAAASVALETEIVGRHFGGYEVTALLGAGGMGEVYRARDVRLRRDVALKVFQNVVSVEAVQRCETEARAASVLNHPNIVTIYGVGEEGDTAYIAMELVRGRTLREVLSEGPLPISRVLDIAVQLGEAIAAAHSCGIIHRDLKPDNVMIAPEGRVKVLDFGIARLQHELSAVADSTGAAASREISEVGPLLGTVPYMSPEQARGRTAGPASDQFSFGLICYEMLTGRRPFARATRSETLTAVVDEPTPLQDLREKGEQFLPLLERCLAKNPEARYADSAVLATQLRRLKDDWTRKNDRQRLTRRQALWIGSTAAAGLAAGLGAWGLWPNGPALQSLAVLPFHNPARDENTEYLCDGITETLIRRLSALPSIRVIARATAFTFKGTSIDPRMAGQRLGVHATLSGAVTRRGGRVLVSTELVDSATGVRLWGSDYDRPSGDVLGVQNEIAAAIIAEGIHLSLTDEERRRFLRTVTDDTGAYELFLRAAHHVRLETENDYIAARQLLLQAVSRDPRFALGFVTLASTYSVMTIDGYSRPADSWPESDRNVKRALAIDPDLPDAHAEAASSAFFYRWDRSEAERQWSTALQSRRGEVQSELLLACALQKWASGQTDAALEMARTARQVDPLNVQASVREGDLLATLGRHDEAVSTYERVIRDVPGDPRARFGLAEVRRKQRRFDEAIAARRRAHASIGDDSFEAHFIRARGEAGYDGIVRAAARQELERLTVRAGSGGYVSPLDFGRAFAQLGEAQQAFKYLEGAFEERAAGLVLLRVDPAWDRIRSDLRFEAAIRRVGIS